jgi:dipeptidyl aminopeptidase/acylaminoacyl peptidase
VPGMSLISFSWIGLRWIGLSWIQFSWLLLFATGLATSAAAESYARPVAALDALVDLPKPAQHQLSPDQTWLLQAQPVARPTIAELKAASASQLGLAGITIDVKRRLLTTEPRYTSFSLQSTDALKVIHQISAPADSFLLAAQFSPDSRYLSFILADQQQLQLQLLDLRSGARWPKANAKSSAAIPINASTGVWYQWASDSQSLIAPVAEPLPAQLLQQINQPAIEPIILHSDGEPQPQRTLQLLLKNSQQQQLFAALLRATVQRFDLQLQPARLTEPMPLQQFALSPDRQHLLLASLPLPYSYQSRYDRFAVKRQVLHLATGQSTALASQPLDEGRKTRKGPRAVQWLADAPATLIWRELRQKKNQADSLWQLTPGQKAPKLLVTLPWRLAQVYDGPAGQLLLLEEKSGIERASWLDVASGKIRLWYQQATDSPEYLGTPLLTPFVKTANSLLLFHTQQQPGAEQHRSLQPSHKQPTHLLLRRESTDRQQQLWAYDWEISVASQTPALVWQSQRQYREQVKAVFSDQSLLLERQSPILPPAFWRWQLGSNHQQIDHQQTNHQQTQLTVAPQLPASWTEVAQQQVSFARSDGTKLSGTLYLPKDFARSQGPLPTLIWAYPREYESQQQLQAAVPHPLNYPQLSANNAAVLAAAGFAVFDKVTMPILVADKKLANDQYLPQLIANAEAAVAVLERLGVAKRGEIAIGGHSYGAFMVANLLAHTDLFAAGIARSGAYNRTLTPFGFQSEQRNLWQQQQLYLAMSPYLVANKIRAPLLLIHGEADSNSGTRPQQSELMFAALRGLGIPSRLVLLPYEGHHYQARESVLQLLAEQYQWLHYHLLTAKRPGAVVVTH